MEAAELIAKEQGELLTMFGYMAVIALGAGPLPWLITEWSSIRPRIRWPAAVWSAFWLFPPLAQLWLWLVL